MVLTILRIPRRPYVGHDNLKVELRVFSHYKVLLTFHIHENHQKNVAKNLEKSHKYRMLLFASNHNVCKNKIYIEYINHENPDCLNV